VWLCARSSKLAWPRTHAPPPLWCLAKTAQAARLRVPWVARPCIDRALPPLCAQKKKREAEEEAAPAAEAEKKKKKKKKEA
jgi:hypothetical protein